MAVGATNATAHTGVEPVGETDLWEEIVSPVHPMLEQVTQRLNDQVACFELEISAYARYALANQGKQIRPVLVGLAGLATGEVNSEHVGLAVIIEMVHLATLVHDDIMDQASMRRRKPTVAATWGSDVAVLLGDCLFAHALKLASSFPTPEVCRCVATSTQIVCSGEIMQTHRRRRWTTTREEYLQVVVMKTAELFGLACELGARISRGTQAEQAALRRYGIAMGTAYQMYDDCLDLYGTEQDAGKSLGTDLANGKLTLPLLLFLEQAAGPERTRLIDWLEDWQPSYVVHVRRLIDSRGIRDAAMGVIDGFLAEARTACEELDQRPARASLNHFVEFLSQRIRALGV